MPPLELKGVPVDFESWPPDQLFEEGNDAYDEGEWEQAAAYYDRIVRKHSRDPLVPSALFNAGLAFEHQEQFEIAERYFAALVDRYPAHQLTANALWNLVELQERRKAWSDVLATLDFLMKFDLDPDDLFELEIREWLARTVLEPSDDNVERLETLAVEFSRRLRQGDTLDRDVYARIFWTIGEVYLGRSQAVVIMPDAGTLDKDLERKAALLLRAQDAYMRTIRALSPYWATGAVFRIGFAYESFYADLVSAPAPSELSGDERQVYFDEVRKTLTPVKRKAEMAYERIIRFSRQYSMETEWIKRAEEHLRRLRRLKIPG